MHFSAIKVDTRRRRRKRGRERKRRRRKRRCVWFGRNAYWQSFRVPFIL